MAAGQFGEVAGRYVRPPEATGDPAVRHPDSVRARAGRPPVGICVIPEPELSDSSETILKCFW